MIVATMKSFLCCAALVVMHPLAGAAVYVPPQEDGLILRRDLVLLDEGSMRGLASDLAELAAGIAAEPTPQSLRAASQMVALGSFLDSGHKQIKALNSELSEKRTPKASDDTALARAKRRVQDIVTWLETEQAGPGGKAFAAYLKDPLAVANDPDAVAKDDSLARWKGIVAPPQAFEDPKQATAAPPDLASPTTDDSPKPPVPGQQHPGAAELKLETVAVHAPFLAWDSENGRFAAVVANVKATVKHNPEAQGFNFRFPTDGLSDYTSLLRAMRRGPQKPLAIGAVAAIHGKLPEPVQAQLSVGDHQKYVDDNIEILHGAAAVLMEASLSGIEPRKDVTIIGYPDENGKWRSPRRMWERLKTYEEVSEDGGILVVPTDSVPVLEAFLVFEKPEFFMKRQVILAGSFAEVIEIVQSSGDDGWLAQASENFSQIQKANTAGTSGLGIYLANRHVRDRLQELRTQAPRHASAALLLVQGSGLRPFKVSRKVAAEELRARMAPVTYASGYNSSEFPDQEALQSMLDRARPALEEFLPKISSDERPLYEEAAAILTSVKALIRYTGSESQKRNLTAGRDQLRADWTKFRAHLATAAGEPTAEEIAAKEKKEDEEAQKAKEAAASGK
jgi:hypothetical protein